MADGTANVDEHERVGDHGDEGVLIGLLLDVVDEGPLSQIVSLDRCQSYSLILVLLLDASHLGD